MSCEILPMPNPFAHLNMVWVAFVIQACILFNSTEANLLGWLAYFDIALAAATATTTTNQTKKNKQTSHRDMEMQDVETLVQHEICKLCYDYFVIFSVYVPHSSSICSTCSGSVSWKFSLHWSSPFAWCLLLKGRNLRVCYGINSSNEMASLPHKF